MTHITCIFSSPNLHGVVVNIFVEENNPTAESIIRLALLEAESDFQEGYYLYLPTNTPLLEMSQKVVYICST